MAKWHQQPGPIPRTSSNLLDTLTSAFRRELDYEHPPAASSSGLRNRYPLPQNPDSSFEATDRHLSEVLNNPLFRVSPSTAGRPTFREKLARDPMGVFDDKVASGAIRIYDIEQCLKSQLALVATLSPSNAREAMKSSRAGSKISSWFWNSNDATRAKLWRSPEFVNALCIFMVVEGLQDTLMRWLTMCVERRISRDCRLSSSAYADRAFLRILYGITEYEVSYGRGLSSAMEYYTQACRMRLAMDDFPCNRQVMTSMINAAFNLGNIIAESDSKRIKEIPVDVFEEFTALLSATSPRSLIAASMPLYHPTDPDLQLFLEHLRHRVPKEGNKGLRPKPYHEKNSWFFYQASSTAMRLLVSRGYPQEASEVANMTQRILSSRPQSDPTDETSPEDNLMARRLGKLHSALAIPRVGIS